MFPTTDDPTPFSCVVGGYSSDCDCATVIVAVIVIEIETERDYY